MEKTEINLVILSPTPEVNKLTFSSLPTSTTIAELKDKITAAVATHPVPGRQRLIYRGHALIDGKRTLKDTFTPEMIDSSETLSLHLVLPPEASASQGASSTPSSIHNRDQLSSTPQQTQGNTNGSNQQSQTQGLRSASGVQASVGQRNVASPHGPGYPIQAQQGHVHGALPNGPFPPQLQQAFAQFQAVNQQLATQLAAMGTNPGLQGLGTQQAQAQQLQPPHLAHPMHSTVLAQQQHARAVGGQVGLGPMPQSDSQANQPRAPATQQANVQGPMPMRSLTPANNNTVIRENHGPHGERWQMVIQSGQVNVNPNHNPRNLSNPLSGDPRSASPAAPNASSVPTVGPSLGLMQFQSNLGAMEAAMAGGNPLPEAVFEQARHSLSGIPDLSQEVQSSLSARLNNAAHRAHHLRENLNNHLSRAAQDRVARQRTTQGAESSAVYVLSSPSGPQALLVSPHGLYSTPWYIPSLGYISDAVAQRHMSGEATLNQRVNLNGSSNGQEQPTDGAASAPAQQPVPQQVNPAEAAQVQQQQQINQVRDLIRILLPLGGHLWLLIRLFGFVYFFTAGAGWRRTILLGLVACLVFVAQTGAFRPVIQAIWVPIRRHAEGLVPLAGNDRPPAATVGAGDNANAALTQPTNRELTPQEAAERLLQEREGRDVGLLRQGMRRVERAIALFIASLVPGVGERHIAAREAAEAARLAEVRQREEQTRRAEDERQQREGITFEAGVGNASAAGEGAPSPQAPRSEPGAEVPLVEV